MAKNLKRFFQMKPEVNEIFTDLEAYLNYCRDNMLKYDERDLYKSDQYKRFDKERRMAAK
jgi:3-hydroxy-3-methylglutaryl CoA synthase